MAFSFNKLTISLLYLLFGLFNRSQAQDLVGCEAVNCPNEYENRNSPTCQVESTDMTLVGLLFIESPLSEDDLTWTIGDSGLRSTTSTYNRTVTRSFYLGTPPSLDLTSSKLVHRGCAIFVISPDRGAYQVHLQSAPQYANGACGELMGEDCVGDLTAKIEVLAQSNADGDVESFCASIVEGLQAASLSSCDILSQPTRFEAVALTGSQAPQPITKQGNGSSNCWPTLPKTNDLTKVFDYDHVAPLDDTVPWLGYNPLITVFQPIGNQTGILSDNTADVQLTCMKVVASVNYGGRTFSNGTETGEAKGGASMLRSDVWTVVVMVVGTIFFSV